MTWHLSDAVAIVWPSTALRANRYSCTLVWAEWVRAHGGWRKDGFGRELDPQNCTTGKFIPVCGLTELAGDFFFFFPFVTFDNPVSDVLYMMDVLPTTCRQQTRQQLKSETKKDKMRAGGAGHAVVYSVCG